MTLSIFVSDGVFVEDTFRTIIQKIHHVASYIASDIGQALYDLGTLLFPLVSRAPPVDFVRKENFNLV